MHNKTIVNVINGTGNKFLAQVQLRICAVLYVVHIFTVLN